jgi:hypothetical protein
MVERQRREEECFDEHERRTCAYLEMERERAVAQMGTVRCAIEGTPETIAQRHGKVASGRTVMVTQHERTRLGDFRICDEPERLTLDSQTIKKIAAKRRQRNVG